MIHCSADCDQGRRECPTPDLCRAERVDLWDAALGFVLAIALVAVAVGCAVLIAWAHQ